MFRFNKKPQSSFAQSSYSQCGEDLIVKFIFDQLNILKPSYIDIGAHHPFYLSNTALFYELGSRGINIEPNPVLFKDFAKHRKEDKNLNIGIGTESGNADFYLINVPTLNTFSKHEAENYKKEGDYFITGVINIPINTLACVVNEHSNGRFPQFLNIDAEGVDELIISSINYEDNYPIVICVETISFSTSGNGKKNTRLIEYIKERGYMFYADTYINSIFVRKEVFQKLNK